MLCIVLCSCHSWLDCTKDVGQGMNTGPQDCRGFSRGYPGRIGGVNVDQVMTYRIQPAVMGQNPLICANTQQSSNSYTDTYYMATAKAGETLRLRWTPNGHQQGAGQDPRTYTIHWTGVAGTQLRNRLDLNSGNQILGPTAFDAECFCNNCAGNPCYGHLTIPAGTPTGVYSFVWYWVFNRDANSGGEEYTTCFDVNVQGLSGVTPPPPPPSPTPAPETPAPNVSPVPSTPIEQNQSPSTPKDIATSIAVAVSGNCTAFCDASCGVGQYSSCDCTNMHRTVICTSNGAGIIFGVLACLIMVMQWL